MTVLLLRMALQLAAAAPAVVRNSSAMAPDSMRDLSRARVAQAAFERSRRRLLPIGAGSAGRCDVRLGRFCWWYDERATNMPPEPATIGRLRAELLAVLDTVAVHLPGDDWLRGMRVHYWVDGHNGSGADSVARACGGTPWWCAALRGYASHALGNAAAAESAFASAVAVMPGEVACTWQNIAPLLDDDARSAYERMPCSGRLALERRYWLLSRAQLSANANEWRNEFNARRVLVWLGERGATPHLTTWGWDAAELVLRYGWPVSWSRLETSSGLSAEPAILGHDPSPSFAFAPRRILPDSTQPLTDDDWDVADRGARARYLPRLIRRMTRASAQFARFRRGDSTLVAAVFLAADDSLRATVATIGAAAEEGLVASHDSATAGRTALRVMLAGTPVLAGVDVVDTLTRTVARARTGFAALRSTGRVTVSDILLYQGGAPAHSLVAALAGGVAGDVVRRDAPIGLFWETYGLAPEGEQVDVAVRVDRVDRGFLRSTRQRLGLSPVDSPIRMQWVDARPPADRAAPHTVSISVGTLEAGRYRITLTVTPANGPPASTIREVTLREN